MEPILNSALPAGLDMLVLGLILLFVVGERFARWPDTSRLQFFGNPREYIDRVRYATFFALYQVSFLILVFIILIFGHEWLLGLFHAPLPDSSITQAFGQASFTYSALIAIALMDASKLRKWDELWRERLQQWARIPGAVGHMSEQIRNNPGAFRPLRSRAEEVFAELRRNHNQVFWDEVERNLGDEKNRNSNAWLVFRALYLLRIVKDVSALANNKDLEEIENKLLRACSELPNQQQGRMVEPDDRSRREISEVEGRLREEFCKYVARNHKTIADQYQVLNNYGFCVDLQEAQGYSILKPAFYCVIFITLVCFGGVFMYLGGIELAILAEIPGFSERGPRLESSSLVLWSLGSAFCIVIAVIVALFADVTVNSSRKKPEAWVHMIALVISFLASFVYFQVVAVGAIDTPERKLAFSSLALTFSLMSFVTLRSLYIADFFEKTRMKRSALQLGLVVFAIAGVLQMAAQIGFSGGFATLSMEKAPALAWAFLYGGLRAGLIAYLISFTIQNHFRKQLLVRQRKAPRVGHREMVTTTSGSDEGRALITDLSRTGAEVHANNLEVGKEIAIQFTFGMVRGLVQWGNKGRFGVQFDESDTGGLTDLYNFIKNKYGPYYAVPEQKDFMTL